MVEVGQTAPDLELYDTDRKTVKISDLRGRKTVLAFFPGAFTGVCTKEMCAFQEKLANFNSVDANVVGISVDPPFSNKAFKERYNLTFPILSDFTRKAVHTYDVYHDNFAGLKDYTAAKRSVFILDKNGIVRFKWITENPGVEPDYSNLLQELSKVN